MTTETITLTLRGQDHSYEIDSAAVDILLTAFRARYKPKDIPTVEGDPGHDPEAGTTKPNPITDEAHFARRLRLYSEDVVRGYAAEQDQAVTPTMDAVSGFLTGE